MFDEKYFRIQIQKALTGGEGNLSIVQIQILKDWNEILKKKNSGTARWTRASLSLSSTSSPRLPRSKRISFVGHNQKSTSWSLSSLSIIAIADWVWTYRPLVKKTGKTCLLPWMRTATARSPSTSGSISQWRQSSLRSSRRGSRDIREMSECSRKFHKILSFSPRKSA